MTHLNLQMINLLRSESSEIDSAFNRAEQISIDRATIEKEIENKRQILTRLKDLETAAFHDAVGKVTV